MPVEDLELEPLGGEGGDGSASADPFAAVRASVDRYRQGRVKPSPLDPFASVRKSVDQYRAGGQYPVSQLTLEPLPSFQEEYGPVPRSTIEPAVKELTRQWQTPAGMEQRREEPPVALEPFRKKFGISALAPVERKPSIAKRLAMEVLPTAAAGLAAPFVPATTASFLARVLPEPFASVVQKGSIEEMFRAAGAITDIAQQEIVHRLVPTPAEQRDVNLNYYSTRSLDPKLSAPERQEYQQKYRDLKAKPEATGSFLDVLRPVIPGVVSTGLAAAGVSGPVAALATGKLQEAGVLDPLVLTRAAADTLIEWEGPFMQGLRAFHALGAVMGKGSKAGYRAVQAANAAVAGYFSYDQAKAGAALASEGRWPEAISQFGGATAMAAMGFLGALGIASANPNLSKVEIKGEWWKRFSGSIGKYDDTAKRLFKVATFNDGRQLALYGEQITPEILKDVNAAVAAGDARVTGLSYDQLRDPQKLEVIDYVEAKQRTGIAPEAVRALEPLPAQVEERAVQLGATFESEAERTVREQIVARMTRRSAEIRDEEGNLKPGVTIRTVPPEERARLAGAPRKTYRDIANLDPADQTRIAQIEGEDNLLRSLQPPEAAKLNDAEFDTWLTDRRTIGGKWQVMADPAVTRAHAEGLRETVEALIARGELERADFALMNKVGGRPDKLSVADKKKFDAFDALVKDLKKQVQDARGKPAEVEVPAVTPTAPPPAVARPAEEPTVSMGASEAYVTRERTRIERALVGNRARLEDENLRPEARKAAEVAVTQLEKTIEELDDAIHDRDVYNLGGPDWMAENERVEEILARHEKEKADYDRGGPEQFEEALPVRELALEGLPPANDAAAYQLVLESVDRATPPGEPRLSPEERKRITDNVMNWFWRPAQEVRRPLTWDEVQAIADDVTRYYLGGPPSRAGEMPIPERRRHTPEELEDIAADVANYWRGGGVTREPGPPRRMNAEERQAVADRARERAEQGRGRPPIRLVGPKLAVAPPSPLISPALPEGVKGILEDLKLPPTVTPVEAPAAAALRLEEPPVGTQAIPARPGMVDIPAEGRAGSMDIADLYVDPKTMQFKEDVDPTTGAAHSLDNITAWDPDKAGVIAIWWNPENRKFTIVNGHTRLAAAKRFGVKQVNVLRIQALNVEEARSRGALINIAEGQGTVFDAAKFIRDSRKEGETIRDVAERLGKQGLNLTEDFVNQAMGLARLDNQLFEIAVKDERKLKPKRAATIGNLTEDPGEQWAIFEEIERREKRPGVYINAEEIEAVYRLAKIAGKVRVKEKAGETGLLFPETNQEKDVLMTMGQELVYHRKRLVERRNHFAAASTKLRAEVLREGGSKVEWEENARRAKDLDQEIEVYNKRSHTEGKIAETLADAARRIEGNENTADVRENAHTAIRAAISETLGRRVETVDKGRKAVSGLEPFPELELPPRLTVEQFTQALLATPEGKDTLAMARIFADSAGMSFNNWIGGLASEVRLGGTYWDKLLQDRIARGDLKPGTTLEEAAEKFPRQFQGMNEKLVRGMTEFIADGRAIIHIFNTADASTALHEITHAAYKYLPAADKAPVDRWLDSLDIKDPTERAEAFARAAERYRYEGKAPTAELQPIFARISEWMRKIYSGAKEALLVKPNAEVESVLERMHGGKSEAGKAKPGPLEPLPPAPPKAVLFTPEETASDRTALKKAFGAAPAMQAEGREREIARAREFEDRYTEVLFKRMRPGLELLARQLPGSTIPDFDTVKRGYTEYVRRTPEPDMTVQDYAMDLVRDSVRERFQLEPTPGERKPEPEIDRAVKAGLRIGWIPGGDQVPSRSWISPSGNFAEVPAGKTHDGVAHLMGTTSLSLMKSGWIRKPGEGYYEIYKVNPDVLYVIQQDMDATPRLLDDPRSVIYIDQAVVIGQPHTVRITAADYVQANYNLMEAVGQRFQFPGMQLLQAEEITPEAQRETVQAREKAVRAEAIELQRKRAEAIARHPMPEIVRLAREETPEQRMRRLRAETTGDRMFRLRDERAYKQVLRDDEGLQRIEHQLAAKYVEHDAWSRAVNRVERQATRLEAERQKANRTLQRKMRIKADEASWREWKETTKPLLVGEVMGWADRPDLKQEELPGVPAGSGRVDPSTLAEIARVGDDYYRRRGLTDYDRWSKEMVRTATAGEKTDADKAILARSVEPYLKVAWEQVSGGPRLDPEILKIVTREGMTQYAGGRRDFASWSQHFIDEYGEKSRPYLDTAWRGMAPLARARAEQVVKAHPEAKAQAEADVAPFRAIQEASREEIQAQEAKKAAAAGKKVTTGRPAGAPPSGAPAGGGRGEVGGPGPGAPARVAGSAGSPDLVVGGDIGAGLQKKVLTVNDEHMPRADESLVPPNIAPHLTNVQRQDVALAIQGMDDPAKGGHLNASGTGMGKSLIALGVAEHYTSQGDPVFIVSSAEVFKMYAKDTRPAGTYGVWMDKLGMTSERYRKGMDRFEPGKLYFGTFHDFHEAPVDGKTVLILDESQALKRVEQSQRGLAGVGMAARAKAVLFMTATPIDQPQHIVYLERMGSLEGKTVQQAYLDLGLISRTIKVRSKGGFQFDKRIWEVNPHLGRRVINDRINELTDRLIADGRMIKRELSFDGVDMNVINIPVPNEAHAILRTIEDELTGTMKNPALERALILMHQRRQLEPYKIDAAVRTARREIEQGRSVVVFMSRINRSDVVKRTRVRGETVEEVIYSSEGTAKTLRDRLIAEGVVKPGEIAEIHGNADEKGPVAMGRFQGNQAKVVIATMESGGVGINLDDVVGDHPRSMIIMTAPFSAMENVQAIGRTWRMSSQSYPRVFYLRGEHAIDHWNFTIIQRKMQTLGAMVKGEAPRLDPNAMEAQQLLQSERAKRREEKPGPLMEMIPGMKEVLADQEATKGKIQGEELTARFAGKIATKGRPETGPLFRGTEAAPQRELFGLEPLPEEKPAAAKAEPQGTLFQEDLEMPKSLEGPSRDELHELGRLDVMDARKLGEVLARMGPRAYRPEVFDAFLKRSQEQAREQGRMLDAAEATTKGGAARAAAEEEVLPPAGGGGDLRLTSGEGVTEETIKGRDIRSAQAAYRSQDQALELLPETRPIAETLKSGVDNEWIFRGTFMRRLAEPLEGLGIGGHGWLARKKFLEIGDILDRFEKPLEAIGQKSVRFKKEYDPDLAQRAAKIRDILNEIWEMLPEEATRAGEKAGFIKNYLTHIERVASSSNDLMAGIQQVWDYNFRKPFDDLLAPFKRRPYEYKIQKDAEGQIVRDKSGKPVYLRPTGMGKPGSPFVEHRAGKMEHYELDVRRVLPAYVDSIARVIFRKPVAAEVAEMIRQLPDEIPRARELAESTLRNYTRYDVYREMASDWERFAYSLTRITGRSMLGGKLAIQAYHMGRYLLNTIPELGFKYAIIGAGKVLRHPRDSYNETARLGLLPMALRPAKFRLPTQALDNALGFFGLADFFDRSASYKGFRQKFLDAGMDEFEASQKAISEAKRVSAFIDPVRSIGFFTSSEGAWGATRIFTLQFKHQVARLVEQYSDIVLKARQDPARFMKFVAMAALVYGAQSLTGLKLWHIGPYMLNFGAPAPQQIWKIGTALYQGDVEKAVEETVLWLTPAGLSARHEWQGIKKEGLAGLSAVRKHEPWFERGPTFMRQQPAIRGPLEETFGLKHVKPRRQSARERLGLEPLPLERMEMPQ